LMRKFLGLLRNALFSYSAGLPKEYSFQWVRFDIMWSVLWDFESRTFNGFPTRSHGAKTSTCRDESRSPSSSPVSQTPCLEIHCYTGQSLILFSIHLDRIWLSHDKLPPSSPKQTITSQKSITTVVWNPHGFHVIQSLPKGIKWASRYYSDNILSQIAALRDVASHRKRIVHADNAGASVAKCVTEYVDNNLLKK
jgi:hypothetical protein